MSGRLVIRDLVCVCRRKGLSGVLVIVRDFGWDWCLGMNGEDNSIIIKVQSDQDILIGFCFQSLVFSL